MLLISGGIDSPVAGYMMGKRGLEISAVHFASPPYTSDRALQKVKDLLGQVARYCGRIKLYTVSFTEIQEQIRDYIKEEYSTLVMRRFMMRIANKIAEKDYSQALITGESLGRLQVRPCLQFAAPMLCRIVLFSAHLSEWTKRKSLQFQEKLKPLKFRLR